MRRQALFHLVSAIPTDQRDPSRSLVGIDDVQQADQFAGIQGRSALYADRVADAAEVSVRPFQWILSGG